MAFLPGKNPVSILIILIFAAEFQQIMGIVAIIGRPNVGKSSLFNRLIDNRQAIVDDQSGVTRDRNYGKAEWNGRSFNVIDTGGYVPESEDLFERAIREQVHIAMEEADVLIFVVDSKAGILPLDEEFAKIVRRSPKKVILATNKIDEPFQHDTSYAFYELGLGDLYPVSAMTGYGVAEMLERVFEMLPEETVPDLPEIPRIAIIGRPNVGKSSFVNALLGRDANIVTPIAGTTRDSVDTRFTAFGHDMMLVDTAGLRKRAKEKDNIEFYSTMRTIRSIEQCDIALLLLDAQQGIEAQDMAIISLAIKNRKGLVIAVNKWDLVPDKETNTAKKFTDVIKDRLKPFDDVPILFISVQEKQRLLRVLDDLKRVFDNRNRTISTNALNEAIQEAVEAHHPPSVRGNIVTIKYATQVKQANSPTFLLFSNKPKDVPESYQRYLENQLRKRFDFTGVPINLFFRQK